MGHKQRLAYALVAASLAVVVGAAAAGGFLLHRSADIQRQTLRIQELGGLAFQLQYQLSRAQTEGGVTAGLAYNRARSLAAAGVAFRLVRAHDAEEGRRIQAPYIAYVRDSTRAFESAAVNDGKVSVARQRQVEGRLASLEMRIDAAVARQARATRVTNPEARLALIIAAVAAALLVAVLIWQFEMQRRAGRIDRDSAERSDELMRLRGDFVAAVSHELRTPLTSILGYLELIRDDESVARSADEAAFLGVVQRNAERLLRLVTDLLLVAEADDAMLALQIDDVDLRALASECVEAAKPAADARRIELTVIHGSPGPLRGDPDRLAQLMDNLVSNAIKFTPEGGHVTVTTADRDGQDVFEVADSGPGISLADQVQLFDPFFRTRSAMADATPGTGLGLTITKAIVDAHRGSIHISSVLGAGTTFSVRLPRSHAASDLPPARTRSTANA